VRTNLTDRSLFEFFVWSAPFLLFANVISFATKNSIGGIGTNLFVGYVVLLSIMALSRKKKRDAGLALLLLIISFMVLKSVVRQTGGGIEDAIASLRSYVFFAMHYFLGCVYLDSEARRSRLLRAISTFTVASAIIGILHYHFFYNIPFIDLKYATDAYGVVLYLSDESLMRFRETSLYYGPNVFAYMLVFGYVCYYQTWLMKSAPLRPRLDLNIVAVTSLIAYALILTDSRSALFLLFIIIVLNVIRGRSGVLVRLVVPLAIIFVGAALLAFNERFSIALALSDPRFAKMLVAYTLLSQSSLNWLIGLPAGSAWDMGGISFSDNLYGALLLQGGVVLIVFLAIFALRSKRAINSLTAHASAADRHYLAAAKYSLLFFMLYGFFAIPTLMTCLFNYLGLLLGGVTRVTIANNSK
jgi:hypothetical protein